MTKKKKKKLNFDAPTLDTTERLEGQILGTVKRVMDSMSEEDAEAFAVALILPYEERLRATQAPDHPALALVDEWRANEVRKKRGFE